MPNYLEVLGQYYPGIGASCNNDPTDYDDIIWDSTVISKAALDSASQVVLSSIPDEGISTGFANRSMSVISYNESTRTFTISPTQTYYNIYNTGARCSKIASESVVWPDVEGFHHFYFNSNNVLITDVSFLDLYTNAIIAYLYWDATSKKVIIFADERHGIDMGVSTHLYLHNTFGAKYSSGLALGNYTITGTGENDVDAMISVSNGVIYDEDLNHTIVHDDSPSSAMQQFLAGTISSLTGTPTSSTAAKIPLYYRSGSSGYWRKRNAVNAPVYKGTNRLYVNQYVSNSWDLVEAAQDEYVAVWLYATNNRNEPIIGILGQLNHISLSDARVFNQEYSLNLAPFAFAEVKSLYRLIYQTSSSYANSFKARLVSIDDYRLIQTIPGTATPYQTLSSLTVTDNIQLNVSRVRQAPSQTISSGTATLDYTKGDFFVITASGNITIALANIPSNAVSSVTLKCTNFGSYMITWPSGTKWAGGYAPSLTASGSDLISFMTDADSNRYGVLLARDIK
jgi:hypothetical protein